MGIEIHYAFVRRKTPATLMKEIHKEAIRRGMKIRHFSQYRLLIDPHPQSEWIDLNWRTWQSIRDEKEPAGDDADYWQWVKGIVERFYLRLIRDDDWICLGFTKTQFAGINCHCEVAELLRRVACRCRLADIGDEAGYYEGGKEDYDQAKEAFDANNKAISLLTAQLKEQFGAGNVFCGQDFLEPSSGPP